MRQLNHGRRRSLLGKILRRGKNGIVCIRCDGTDKNCPVCHSTVYELNKLPHKSLMRMFRRKMKKELGIEGDDNTERY